MKKIIILFTILLTAFTSTFATNYYVSGAGNDAASGTSQGTAWKTISKLNASWGIINPGDSILFRRGDVFIGTIVVGKSGTSGNPIIIGSYGLGDKPVISGYKTLTGFTNPSTNVYQISLPEGNANFINLEFNGVMQRFARTPNAGITPYYYEASSGTTTTTNFTDNQLSASPSLVGAEVGFRKARWIWERGKITSHSGTNVTYGLTGLTVNGGAGVFYTFYSTGYGYFIQNTPSALDQTGEFYFNNSTKALQVYSSTNIAGHTVRASAYNNLLTLSNRSYITVENLHFEGANISPVYVTGGSNVQIKNLEIDKSGAIGIQVNNSGNLLIQGNDVDWSLSTGIQANCSGLTNINILDNIVNHSYPYEAMGDYGSDGSCLRGIVARGNSMLIQGNDVFNSGYSGITFQGSNVIVRKNIVDTFSTIQDDNAGIYTYVGNENAYGAPTSSYINRTIDSNIILNGIGAPYGARPSDPTLYASGVYTDGKSQNLVIKNNFIKNMPRGGITSNNPTGFNIKGNIFYNDSFAIRHSTYKKGLLGNYSADSNIFVQTRPGQIFFNYATDTLRYANMGVEINATVNMNRNFFYQLNPQPFKIESPINYSPFSLQAWRAFTGEENNSVNLKNFASYTITPGVITNKYNNGAFNTNISGVTTYSATGAWDNTNQISGGSYRATFSSTTPNSWSATFSNVGSLSGNYLFRFKTKGTATNGILRVFVANAATPTSAIVVKQIGSYGTDIKQHEFLINATSANAIASIELDRSGGTTYIDDIQFYAVTATNNNLTDSIRVEYAGRDTNFVNLGALKYKDPYGNIYNGGIDTLLPYESRVYIYESPADAPDNVPPIANAGATQQIQQPTNQVTLTGTDSDSDGIVVNRAWSKLSGGSTTIFNPNSNNTLVQLNNSGTYIFQYSVTDNAGATTTDTVSIVVLPPNISPIVDAGIDQTIQLPINSVGVVSVASDVDGTVNSYNWSKLSGPTATIVTPTNSSTTITNLTAGNYTFRVTVTDNQGATATDNVQIIVLPANIAPVANAGVDKVTILPADSVRLNGSGTDADGTVASYLWEKVSGDDEALIVSPNSASTLIGNLVVGNYVFKLTVTDNQGAINSDNVNVIVGTQVLPNEPPIVNAGNNRVINSSSVTLIGSATDLDGNIISYKWSKSEGNAATIVTPDSSTTVITNLKRGTRYVFGLTATDNSGVSVTDYIILYISNNKWSAGVLLRNNE